MKQGIHPEFKTVTVVCACGNSFETKSTVDSIHLCNCTASPQIYTGKQRLVDTAGRVDRFKRKYGDIRSEDLGRDADSSEEESAEGEEAAEPRAQPEAIGSSEAE